MVRIPADMREHRWFNPHTRVATTFRPHGKLHVVGQELVRNPRASVTKKPTLAARLFVRLQVGAARRCCTRRASDDHRCRRPLGLAGAGRDGITAAGIAEAQTRPVI